MPPSGTSRCYLRSTQPCINELAGVPGQVQAIRPGVAPDGERAGETRGGHRRREAFKCHCSRIVDRCQRPEEGGKIDRAGAQIATVVFSNMHIAQLVATCQYRGREVGLLDVHMVRVQVYFEVVRTCVRNELERLFRGIDQVALVAVNYLEAESNSRGCRLLCQSRITLRLLSRPSM